MKKGKCGKLWDGLIVAIQFRIVLEEWTGLGRLLRGDKAMQWEEESSLAVLLDTCGHENGQQETSRRARQEMRNGWMRGFFFLRQLKSDLSKS